MVVIGDAEQDVRFAGTPYITRNKPKSILCTPVLHRGKPVAILYLENNRIPDAFVGAVEAAIASDTRVERIARSDAMRGETWERRVAAVAAAVERVREARAA